MIEHQKEKYSWEFIFMGANIDVAAEGSWLGIAPDMSLSYEASAMGTARMFAGVSAMSTALRRR